MLKRATVDDDLDFIDIFCGAGGSSIGLTEAGLNLKLAANHEPICIETHQTNFTWAEHVCADVNNYDMRRLPPARILWASPICWESSPAGGNAKPRAGAAAEHGQTDLFVGDEEGEPEPDKEWERTRATAYDVLRATEVWQYDAVLIENVIEFATRWPLFGWWLEGMGRLGYQYRIVCVNSAHIGDENNPFAPQWRDRMYIVFVREGVPMPDVDPRPIAYCFDCDQDVYSRQTWKDTPLTRRFRRYGTVGKYRSQYNYTCPNTSRRHKSPIVEPYVLPAAAAIDWSDVGPRIGDRKRPLEPTTMRKILAGIELVMSGPTVVQVNHGGHDGRHYSAWQRALATRTIRGGDGIACPPFAVQVGGNKCDPSGVIDSPMRTRMTRETDGLVVPPFIAELRGGGSTARPVDHPAAAITAGGLHHLLVTPDGPYRHPLHHLVIPYRQGAAKTTGEPLHTVATKDSAALVRPDIDVMDCRFRMFKAREHLRAQRFPDPYKVCGNGSEQTMQAGNAVSANVAHWFGRAVKEALS